jgi:hypothetical protein
MKKLLLILPLLISCKTTKKAECDAYGMVTVCDTIIFDEQHIHSRFNNKWECYEFPSDTLEIDRVLSLK